MRIEELDLKELLEVDAEAGPIRFAGQRALIFDPVAQGLLRKELLDTFGVRVARGLLSRFGYAHGQRLTYTPDRVRLFLFNDPFDEPTRKELKRAVTSGSSVFLKREIWLPVVDDIRNSFLNPSPEVLKVLKQIGGWARAG